MNLSIIIPSKTRTNLEACIKAVRAAGETCRIIVVDDFPQEPGQGHPLADCNGYIASSTECAPMLWAMGERPFIFARNINIGIRAADTDDVALLNDDALLQTPHGFTLLQQAAQEHPEYGVVAATTNNVGNLNQRPKGIGLREDPRMCCFVCVLIPRRTIDVVGLLDERFGGPGVYGFEDDDLCYRVRRAGLKIGIHDNCFVDHASLRSSFRGQPHTSASLDGGRRLFVEKWGAYPL